MRIDVLDHGFVELVKDPVTNREQTWGSDEAIIAAARMSTDKGFLGWGPVKCPARGCMPVQLPGDLGFCERCNGKGYIPGDEKLLDYLYTHKHMTPFEMAGMVIEVQAPIFVFREWHRHRTQSYNEMSARYVPLPDVNYVPTVERLMMNSKTNKQAGAVKDAQELTESNAERFRGVISTRYHVLENEYQNALAAGVPKELARLILPVGRYSRMRASTNLRCWMMFLTLRMDEHAQWEIRQFANAVFEIMKQHFPRATALFEEGLT